MTDRYRPQEPPEIVAGRVAAAAVEMLAREIDDVCLDSLGAGVDPRDPRQKAAEVANRIVVLSRRLIVEIQRYERYAWLCWEIENEEKETRTF
jgi:hypothetical protein